MKVFFFLCIIFVSTSLQSKAEEKEITLWVSNGNIAKILNEIAQPFNKKYKVTISAATVDNTVEQFKTNALGGKGPDVIVWAHDIIGTLVESGLITSVEISPSVRKEIFPVALDAFTYNGKLYGYPYNFEHIALIYNKKLIKIPPKTFEELLKVAQNFTKNDHYGFLFPVNDFYFSYPIFKAFDVYIFGPNARDIGLNSKRAIEAATYIKSFTIPPKGSGEKTLMPIDVDYNTMMRFMITGKLAMMINGAWSLPKLQAAKIDYGIAPIPTIRGKKALPFIGSYGFYVSRMSTHKILIKTFIENYIYQDDALIRLYKEERRAPAIKTAYNKLKDDPIYKADLEGFSNAYVEGAPMPNVRTMASVFGTMKTTLSLITRDKESVSQALNRAVDVIKKSSRN